MNIDIKNLEKANPCWKCGKNPIIEISKEKDEKCEIKNIDEETEIDELTSQIVDMIINEEINLVIVI